MLYTVYIGYFILSCYKSPKKDGLGHLHREHTLLSTLFSSFLNCLTSLNVSAPKKNPVLASFSFFKVYDVKMIHEHKWVTSPCNNRCSHFRQVTCKENGFAFIYPGHAFNHSCLGPSPRQHPPAVWMLTTLTSWPLKIATHE